MGKRLYERYNISPEKTQRLDIEELCVLATEEDDLQYQAVTQRYFSKEKATCPTCGGKRTRTSKIVTRKLKDILPSDDGHTCVIDLIFEQRYFRCRDCKNRVFPEEVLFAEPGCRYSNRLSDLLAEGTLTHSYSKVCAYYGVPASKTSVGVIMRRIFRQRWEQLAPLKTPKTLSVIIVNYLGGRYPIVMNVAEDAIYFIDILKESSDDAYKAFFSQFDAKEVQRIFVDADEQLIGAVSTLFPTAQIVMTEECLMRCIQNAFCEIIDIEGKYTGIPHRFDVLTRRKSYLQTGEKRRVRRALEMRPRLRAAYNAYQELLIRMDAPWTGGTILQWIDQLPEYLTDETPPDETLEPLLEFDIVKMVLDLYGPLFDQYINLENKPSAHYASTVAGVIDAVVRMPSCIYEVLRARMTLNSKYETVTIDDKPYRIGIPVNTLIQSMNAITDKIKGESEDYGYQSEDTASWH